MHLKNIYAEKELAENSVAKVFLATAADGKNYRIKHYHLDAIIAVGYRVNSKRALNKTTSFEQTIKRLNGRQGRQFEVVNVPSVLFLQASSL